MNNYPKTITLVQSEYCALWNCMIPSKRLITYYEKQMLLNQCYVEAYPGKYLCRKLPNGRILKIDSMDGNLFRPGGVGLVHLNMCMNDNSPDNLELVDFEKAIDLLIGFICRQ